ncbi:hypothetical protein PSTT_09407 [Puccinia striiformis]|uniref:DNA 3'-5' helicase n=1 Tax=Puccinia striiformis TaxID=27350 RepID=A0A2S4V8G1_9BASI|nr:hypothetical protein PSTT_09407 [Puccinia striiformis]
MIPDDQIPATLIYSPTRNLTWQALKAINESREIRGGHHDPASPFARRFHSTTGDLDKFDIIEGFEQSNFPVVSCTMALGLGQNWKRVQRVVHLGRGDPSSICQMIGRCGGDDNPGLGIMFVEKNRRTGKNKISDFPNHRAFENGYIPSDDDRMDALAITPVCLRVAFALDNMLGYIPLSNDDPNVISEKNREANNGFARCLCSNCEPESAEDLVLGLKYLSIANFKPNIVNPELDFLLPVLPLPPKLTQPRSPSHAEFKPGERFRLFDARRMALAHHNNLSADLLEKAIGGESIDGQMDFLQSRIDEYVKTERFLDYLSKINEAREQGGAKKIAAAAKKQAAMARRAEKAIQKELKAQEARRKEASRPKNKPAPTRQSARNIQKQTEAR